MFHIFPMTSRRTARCFKAIVLTALTAAATQAHAQVATSYIFSQRADTYSSIVGGTVLGTQTGGSGNAALDNIIYPGVPIGFTFRYGSGFHSTVSVSTNGFITFGSVAPSATTYNPISVSTAYAGAVSAFGRRLEGGFLFTADRTAGSNLLTNVAQTTGLVPGVTLSGTGIPAGAQVQQVRNDTVEMTLNATSTGAGASVTAWTGELRYETIGTAPDRVFVVQWKGFKPQGTNVALTHGVFLNFQARLYEADHSIETVYGPNGFGAATSSLFPQVGLRGPTNSFPNGNVSNRTVPDTVGVDWVDSDAGTTNGSTCAYSPLYGKRPLEGQVYRWANCWGRIPYAVFDGTLHTEGFESWESKCSGFDVPSANWTNSPPFGRNTWRRYDQGLSDGGWPNDNGGYAPASTEGSFSARFHTWEGGTYAGNLDLYIDMGAALGTCELRFGHIDRERAGGFDERDTLSAWLSTDGGATFALLGDKLATGLEWTERVYPFTSNSPTTVVRLRATRDRIFDAATDSDIGVDNLRIIAVQVGIADIPGTATLRWLGQDGDGHWLRTDDAVVRDWEVLDATGRVVLAGNSTARSGRLRIGLADQGSGTYVVRVLTDRGPATVRLVHLAH